jgi:acetyl-CoA C-acetyltransferase
MQAIINGYNQIALGRNEIIVAGGMESMSNAPYLSLGSRFGIRLGHTKLIDHMFYDGLEDAYENGRLMGSFAEDCAKKYDFSREAQDEYAIASLTRALGATENMRDEIEPVKVKSRKGEAIIDTDEGPRCANAEKITSLKPVFAKDGTITAANSSSISDGAAALVLTSSKVAAEKGSQVSRARVVGYAGHAQEPGWFTTAPVSAAKKLLSQIGWDSADVDLWEVNEAFAVVAMAFMHDLGLDYAKVNVNGGACALGHPIGASGARILVTLLHALEKRNLKRGVAAVCIGGGEALAVAIERD